MAEPVEAMPESVNLPDPFNKLRDRDLRWLSLPAPHDDF